MIAADGTGPAPDAPDILICPEGHHNPAGFEFCGECGAPLEPGYGSASSWLRSRYTLAAAGVLAAVLIIAGVTAVVVLFGERRAGTPAPQDAQRTAMTQWWEQAHQPFADLQRSISDSQRALLRLDAPALEDACRQMHDASAVRLAATLPTPEPALTAELTAALDDAHQASHMCLAVTAKSPNNYDGEFVSTLDEATEHLDAAHDMILKRLTP